MNSWQQKINIMNWGNKITIVITTFIVGMLSMVYVASKQSNEMIDGNYYEKELKYQNIIEASNNLKNLQGSINIEQSINDLTIKLPTTATNNLHNGNIEFIKADDSKKDYQKKIQDGTSELYIEKNKLHKGFYKLRIYWENNNIPYYYEDKINIAK